MWKLQQMDEDLLTNHVLLEEEEDGMSMFQKWIIQLFNY